MELLPEGCIAIILSFTTPADTCRLSVVSKLFHSAAESDYVWGRFIPSDVVSLISQSDSQSSLLANSPSNKDLYLALSDRPIIIDPAKKSFHLDKKSGKKCYMIAARALTISWGDTPAHWRWKTMPESRFPEVAKLIDVCWLEIRGVMNTIDLSPSTQYAAYLVFKIKDGSYGFLNRRVELSVGISSASGVMTNTKNVCLDPSSENWRQNRRGRLWPRPNVRSDGWLEIEMGVFFSLGIANEQVQMSVLEVKGGYWKRGLIIQGIEVRPKQESIYLEECFLKSIFCDT